MSGAEFKPSDVVLYVPPLTGTMGRSEAEHAAAVIVRTCAATGDKWRAVEWSEVADVLKAEVEASREPFASLVQNPFFQPSVDDLCRLGFGSRVGTAVGLNEAGIEALRRWVRA